MRKPCTAHIETRNTVNAACIEVQAKMQEILRPYIGGKAIKHTPYKSWIAKIKPQVQALQDDFQARKIRVVFDFFSSVSACVDTYYPEPGSDSAVRYVKGYVWLCSLDGDCVQALTKPATMRTDYTHEGICSTIDKISSLETEISALKQTLGDFGYDH